MEVYADILEWNVEPDHSAGRLGQAPRVGEAQRGRPAGPHGPDARPAEQPVLALELEDDAVAAPGRQAKLTRTTVLVA